jgi:hypothetical protein
MMRGTEVHLKAEYFVKGKIQGVPPILKKVRYELENLKRAKPIVEKYWNYSAEFEVVGDYQGQCVVKSDAAVPPRKDGVAVNIDYKTGKVWPEHAYQASLSAVATKAMFPKSDGVVFEFWYVDAGEIMVYEYTNRQLKEEKAFWVEQGKKMMSMRNFLPEPSEKACKHCFHRTDRGGRCDEWRKV